jgi:hypothetical protein
MTITSRAASINKTAIMMIAVSRVIKMSITATSITTKEAPKLVMARMAMGEFHLNCPSLVSSPDSLQREAPPPWP